MRNGNGVYTLPSNTWNPAVSNTDIDPTDWNTTGADIATALTGSIAADGQTTITANLPMSTFRHTGVGDGAARTDYASLGQTQDGKANWVAAGGTADAITATYSPAITALVDGQLCFVRASAANATTTPTFAPNGLTAHTITKLGGSALVVGDISGAGHELILRYKLASTVWELLNPAGASSSGTWTPTNASLDSFSFSTALGRYVKIGSLVYVSFKVVFPVTAGVNPAVIGGLPFTASNAIAADLDGLSFRFTNSGRGDNILIARNTTTASFFGLSGTAVPNSTYSTYTLTCAGMYQATS